MVYDAKDGYLLLFGGEYLNASSFKYTYYNDTWAFEGGHWVNLTNPVAPSPRFGFGLTYDAEDGYVVLFGGSSRATSFLNDTWTYSGGNWTNITRPQGAPPPRYWSSMTYDAEDAYVVLFGGLTTGSTPVSDTWRFVGGAWTQLFPAEHPSAQHGSALIYDPFQYEVILFGGLNGSGYQNETWAFSEGAWTLLAPSVLPDPRVGAGFTFDPAANVGVLFGGYPANSYPYGVWTYTNGSWAEFDAGSYTPLWGTVWNQMAYDPGDQWVILFSSSTAQTWALNFTSSPLAVTASVTPVTGDAPLAVTFNATASGGTAPYLFSWTTGDGATFSTQNATFTYDAAGTYSVGLWMNDSASGTFVDDWTIEVVTAPLQAAATGAPNPGVVDQLVAFTSTVSGGVAPYSFTWTFGDTQSSSSQDPTHEYAAAGSYSVTYEVMDSNSSARFVNFTEIVDAAPPLQVTASATPLSGVAPLQVSFTSVASGGAPPYSFLWQFGANSATSASQNTSYTYDLVGTYTANLTVRDSASGSVTKSWTVTPEPPPLGVTISASTQTPSVGQVVSFSSIPFGGSAPYTFTWSFGDQGSASSQDPTHSYAATGTFTVTLIVHDKTGNSANATVSEVVSGAGAPSSSSTTGLWEIGIAVVLLLAVILIVLVWRRRKKQPPSSEVAAGTPPTPP
jgi:PKD repeat protein